MIFKHNKQNQRKHPVAPVNSKINNAFIRPENKSAHLKKSKQVIRNKYLVIRNN